MRDRVPTKPNRYAVYDDSHNFIRYEYHERADEPTEGGTPINKANLLKDDTAALYGLGADAVPDEVFAAANGIMTKNLINILRLKLQQSLKANDIDAWSDLLADASGINAEASSGYVLSEGKIINSYTSFGIGAIASDFIFGWDISSMYKVGQTFIPTSIGNISKITVYLQKYGSPSDAIVMKIYDDTFTTLFTTSTNTIPASELTTSYTALPFYFPNDYVFDPSNTYAIVLERTGSYSSSDYYKCGGRSNGNYSDGAFYAYNGSTWSMSQGTSADMHCLIYQTNTAQIIWNAVTSTEPLTNAAITAEEINNGTIVRYLSDDGTNWTEIENLDEVVPVNFDSTSVYLKYELTGDAEVSAVAWGGY